MSDFFFAVRNIRASRVNLIMNDYAAGLPSPLSFLGLADLLVRKLGLTPWCAGVLPVLHRVHVSEGRTKPEMENKSGSFTPIETMEDMIGTVDVSLLLHLPGCDSDSDVRQQLQHCRIAGGLIQDPSPTVDAVPADGSAFRMLRRGYAMVRPQPAALRRITMGDPEGLAETARTLFPAERAPGSGWHVPAAVGYRLLEDPATAPKRQRTRSSTVPHVFAEPVLGIAELVSVRNARLTGLATTGLHELLWRWHAKGDLVLGHCNYHPEHSLIDTTKELISHG
ncbi:MAG: type I-F CRISPR-associated protein Csy2 [Pannonibacter sp.]